MYCYNKIYLPHVPRANVNYIYLFRLYGIAQQYEDRSIKQDIGFQSVADLYRQLEKKIGYSTLKRMLENKEYNSFFSLVDNGSMKWIYLNNDFRKSTENKQSFVVLNPKTYNLLIQQNKNLLAKYTIYIRYMCGICGGASDFTADQFLSTFGYCLNSNETKTTLSQYNKLLEKEGIIHIKRNSLEDGKRRNTYTFLDL